VKTPRLFYFNKETNTQVMEDLPNSLDLKSFLLSDLAKGVPEAAGHALGRSLGTWLRSLHDWAGKPEQGKWRSLLAQNESMKQLKFYINYSMLVDTIANFPSILKDNQGIFEELKNFAAEEMTKSDQENGVGIIHGDFWTGK